MSTTKRILVWRSWGASCVVSKIGVVGQLERNWPPEFKVVHLRMVGQLKSILLLFVMGMIIFPWQLICTDHPLGHAHHHHDGPSPCELRAIAMHQPGEHLLPPPNCHHIPSVVDNFELPQKVVIVPTFQIVLVLAADFSGLEFDGQNEVFLCPPDSKCRSAPLPSGNPLRAPPLA